MGSLSLHNAGFGARLFKFDSNGWMDAFLTRRGVGALPRPGQGVDQNNTVFGNLGAGGKWEAWTGETGLDATPRARPWGCAIGDLDGVGGIDVVTSASARPVHFGLGLDKRVEHVQPGGLVWWPPGAAQTLPALDSGRILQVEEPEGEAR